MVDTEPKDYGRNYGSPTPIQSVMNGRWYQIDGRWGGPTQVRDLTITNFIISKPLVEHVVCGDVPEAYPGHEPGAYLPSCPMCKAEGRCLAPNIDTQPGETL